jgi:uncharacterized membrane protein YfcA
VDIETLIYIAAVFVIAGFVKGFSGLGFSAISIGILATFLDLAVAIPLVLIPSIVSSFQVMIEAGGFTSALREFWPLYIAALPGLAIGIWLLVRPEANIAKSVLEGLLLLYAVWGLLNPTVALPPRLRTLLQGPVGFFTGFFSGLAGVAVARVNVFTFPQFDTEAVRTSAQHFIRCFQFSSSAKPWWPRLHR